MRFLAADDERFRNTFNAVEKGLRRGDHMLRYASEDDFGLPETAFHFCTFWLIEALHLVGRERSEERRVGHECVRKCRSRWSPYHQKQKQQNQSHSTVPRQPPQVRYTT